MVTIYGISNCDTMKKALKWLADNDIELMLEAPSIIKRPILDTGDALHVGFKAERYAEIFT